MKRYVFLLLITAHAAVGQTVDSTSVLPAKSNFKYGLISEFGLSNTITWLPAIRSYFKSNQIRPDGLADLCFTFNFGIRFNRFKLLTQNGISIKAARTYAELPTNGATFVAESTGMSYSGLLIGYDLVNARNRRLYINAGLGGIQYGFNIFRRTTQAIPFQTLLQTSQTGTIPSLLLRDAGYVDVNVEYAQREKRRRSIAYVLRLGYRTGTYAKAYESDAYLLVDPPSDQIRQLYVQAAFSLSTNFNEIHIR